MNEIRNRLIESVYEFDKIKILVVGDIMLDVFEFCHSKNSKPIDSEKPGKRAYRSHEIIKVLGGAGNVAANLASLNIKTFLIGITGNDEHYFKVKDLAEEIGIDQSIIRDETRPTTIKARLYVDDEYLLRRDDEAIHKIDSVLSKKMTNDIIHKLRICDVLILSDYNKGFFTKQNAQEIIRECKMNNIPVVVDFKPKNTEYFKGATLMVPNDTEAKQLLPDFAYEDLENSLKKLYEKLHCQKLLVTLGANGICGFDGIEFFHVPGNKVEAVDAVGCGDTVRAGLAIGLALNLNMKEAAILANDAAAVIVQKPATASITRKELIEFIKTTI